MMDLESFMGAFAARHVLNYVGPAVAHIDRDVYQVTFQRRRRPFNVYFLAVSGIALIKGPDAVEHELEEQLKNEELRGKPWLLYEAVDEKSKPAAA